MQKRFQDLAGGSLVRAGLIKNAELNALMKSLETPQWWVRIVLLTL
jgi:hypothetical protein